MRLKYNSKEQSFKVISQNSHEDSFICSFWLLFHIGTNFWNVLNL